MEKSISYFLPHMILKFTMERLKTDDMSMLPEVPLVAKG